MQESFAERVVNKRKRAVPQWVDTIAPIRLNKRKMYNRGGKIVVALLVTAFCLVTLLTVGLCSSWMWARSCVIKDRAPWASPIRRRNVASPDNTALVNLEAYLRYPRRVWGDRFASLELKNVTISPPLDSNRTQLNLITSCGRISLTLGEADYVQVTEEMVVDTRCFGIFGVRECLVDLTGRSGITNDRDKHYACNQEKSYICKSSMDVNLEIKFELVIYNFEFEIAGDKWKIEQALFSKPTQYCDSEPAASDDLIKR